MKIAVTGGTGFVGANVADRLAHEGHDVVVIGRGAGGHGEDRRQPVAAPATGSPRDAGVTSRDDRFTYASLDITDLDGLRAAFDGCDAVVHCAGINRELGRQTYAHVHVEGTRAVVEAARAAGVRRLVLLSFLRARADGPSTYHRSKAVAERIVRSSGITFTILKAGVIHGRGDHLLDHLSRAFHTFPVFGLVGCRTRRVRPVVVDDVSRILAAAATGDPRLANGTFAVLGPEDLELGDAIRRVAAVVGRRPWFVPLPVMAHVVIGRVGEWLMRVPLISTAQVRILAEGVTEPAPDAGALPADLSPSTPFSAEVIRRGLPPPGGFGRSDLRLFPR